MTTLTGIKDAQYLAQFLGKKIAIRTDDPNVYELYPVLSAIFAGEVVMVVDSNGDTHHFSWDQCQNPYIILMDKEIVIK